MLRKLARNLQIKARAIELALKKRQLPLSPVVGYFVTRNRERVGGPFMDQDEAVDWKTKQKDFWKLDAYWDVIRVYEDGTDNGYTEAEEADLLAEQRERRAKAAAAM